MKRRASRSLGSEAPSKLRKQSTERTVGQTLTLLKKKSTTKSPLQPAKWPSFSQRERKAPSWLASYVTTSAQEKEVKNEKSKPKLPRFPTLVPPSKQKEKETSKKTSQNDKSGEPVSLRRQSTLKLESPPTSSQPISHSKKNVKNDVTSKSSLVRKSTEILNASDEDSNEVADSKNSVSPAERKISVLSKVSKKASVSPLTSETKSKLKKTASHPQKSQRKEINGTHNGLTNVVEICDNKHPSTVPLPSFKPDSSKIKPVPTVKPTALKTVNMHSANTFLLPEQNRPNMLEVVICISTSGALRDYLAVLQARVREMIWRLQSLIPNLRIGVMAHTQGGIHDDQTRTSCGSGDHNYNRVGGHSGTKWLDLGATLSQICAFVDSLDSEPTVYPDYVQDNLEMALWNLQRCMSWSSCSYRTVIMVGRGRPNRTSFYLQKEHWRSWIKSALELKSNMDIPVIDWELEAKFLAQMGIHVFTLQGTNDSAKPKEEDEGTYFFRRVAELTQAQHVRISDPSRLVEIILGICCACHGPDLLLDHRDTVRDDNDGVLPSQLTQIFVSLQLHSKSCSLASLPSMLGNLDIASMRQQLTNSQSSMDCSDDEEESMEAAETRYSLPMEASTVKQPSPKPRESGIGKKFVADQKFCRKLKDGKPLGVKGGRIKKNSAVSNSHTNKKIKQAVNAVTKGRVVSSSPKRVMKKKENNSSSTRKKPVKENSVKAQGVKGRKRPRKEEDKGRAPKRKARGPSKEDVKRSKPSPSSRGATPNRGSRKVPNNNKAVKTSTVMKARAALKLKEAKTKMAVKRGRPKSTSHQNSPRKSTPTAKKRKEQSKTPLKKTPSKAKGPIIKRNEKKRVIVRKKSTGAVSKRNVKALTKKKQSKGR